MPNWFSFHVRAVRLRSDPHMLEVESLGLLAPIAPGAAATHGQHYAHNEQTSLSVLALKED